MTDQVSKAKTAAQDLMRATRLLAGMDAADKNDGWYNWRPIDWFYTSNLEEYLKRTNDEGKSVFGEFAKFDGRPKEYHAKCRDNVEGRYKALINDGATADALIKIYADNARNLARDAANNGAWTAAHKSAYSTLLLTLDRFKAESRNGSLTPGQIEAVDAIDRLYHINLANDIDNIPGNLPNSRRGEVTVSQNQVTGINMLLIGDVAKQMRDLGAAVNAAGGRWDAYKGPLKNLSSRMAVLGEGLQADSKERLAFKQAEYMMAYLANSAHSVDGSLSEAERGDAQAKMMMLMHSFYGGVEPKAGDPVPDILNDAYSRTQDVASGRWTNENEQELAVKETLRQQMASGYTGGNPGYGATGGGTASQPAKDFFEVLGDGARGVGNAAAEGTRALAVDSNDPADKMINGTVSWLGDAFNSVVDLGKKSWTGMGKGGRSIVWGIGGAFAGSALVGFLADQMGLNKIPVIGGLLKTVLTLAAVWFGFLGARKIAHNVEGDDVAPSEYAGQGTGRNAPSSIPGRDAGSVDALAKEDAAKTAPETESAAPAGTSGGDAKTAVPVVPGAGAPAITPDCKCQPHDGGTPDIVLPKTDDPQTDAFLEAGEGALEKAKGQNVSQGSTRFADLALIGNPGRVSGGVVHLPARFRSSVPESEIRVEAIPHGRTAVASNTEVLDVAALRARAGRPANITPVSYETLAPSLSA